MPYSFEIKPELAVKLRKIKKKNFLLFQRIQKRIGEIIENPTHYKPLRYDMKNIRRVHLDPFVLIFSVNENEGLVEFLDLDHHDKIYKR
ncbi:MAG: type II toxin-antitoxin system RelE/ParE family toxin [Euryarchaeota archaeon]|nr:type II toxin-antitoxin system RelE/ParE family toxin [Euryarchaeota archaeon]